MSVSQRAGFVLAGTHPVFVSSRAHRLASRPTHSTSNTSTEMLFINIMMQFLCKEQHGPKRRYERGQMMTFVYYREKTVPFLAHHNS